ncbi:phosphatase [Anabaena sp. UHCC 0187]|uniref:beta-lactamase hydrolase domain-containing protein n=1 Tax=Anabaena sp. UHCC 0187 TaxID=2590018 RepID=UPI001446F2E2|nr:sulfur transferase domain-containing protein [Anabaena sp. UHCC 0187]MDP5015738.1 sulfur transferase domain-containing protein [Dolichospermum sp.]MTJ13528.1 phosphatase [Anabaena sp. UHCC 0187]
MENIKYINKDLAVLLGQPSMADLEQAAKSGFKSVLNLRSPNEEDFVSDEQQSAAVAGLNYVNMPLRPDLLSDELIDQILTEIDQLPKPILSHCKTGLRAVTTGLMYIATREGMSAEAAFAKGEELGFSYDDKPRMQQFLPNYITSRSKSSVQHNKI